MNTYDDIQTIDRRTIATAEDCEQHISALDLRSEAEEAIGRGETVKYLLASTSTGAIEVAYFHKSGRAGVMAGGDSVWTDADNADDALERFLEVDGKKMVP